MGGQRGLRESRWNMTPQESQTRTTEQFRMKGNVIQLGNSGGGRRGKDGPVFYWSSGGQNHFKNFLRAKSLEQLSVSSNNHAVFIPFLTFSYGHFVRWFVIYLAVFM